MLKNKLVYECPFEKTHIIHLDDLSPGFGRDTLLSKMEWHFQIKFSNQMNFRISCRGSIANLLKLKSRIQVNP